MKTKPIKCNILLHKPIIIPINVLERMMVEENPAELISTYVILLYRESFPQPYNSPLCTEKLVEWPGMDSSIKKLEELGLLEVVE